ncbi:hypothetical protein [Umezawaea sp. Da 62-37]|uniref:hypothetical protein n=1 Tax=Umezawaea sp. Da 62-37 TaxID=3075927 RepID=UPI0028F70E9E|nr:hypothetical protein [Umezawaea sp. Da 62-37]WNV84684.1 hypothetical protein RM788_42045 [Umezawaea sp. Da 62-37]
MRRSPTDTPFRIDGKPAARARLLGVLLCVLMAVGCASLKELATLASRIQNEGYLGVSVKHNTSNGFDTLAVTAYKTDGRADDGEAIFRLIWDTYAEDVDRVVVVVNDEPRSATRAELQKTYGPRKIQPTSGSGAGVFAWILIAFLLAGVLTTAVIVLRYRRRRRERPRPTYPSRPYYKEP